MINNASTNARGGLIFINKVVAIQFYCVQLKGKMMSINKDLTLTYIYEPIVNVHQNVLSYELLTRPLGQGDATFNAELFFKNIDVEMKISIFLDQVNETVEHRDFFLKNNLKLNINIDDDHIFFLKSNQIILDKISALKFIDFEIHESCKMVYSNNNDDLDVFFKSDIDMWLDDINLFKMKISEKKTSYFTGVKLDKKYFWEILKMPEREEYFNTLTGYFESLNKKVIVEGVEEKEQFNFLSKKRIFGMQGYLWKRI